MNENEFDAYFNNPASGGADDAPEESETTASVPEETEAAASEDVWSGFEDGTQILSPPPAPVNVSFDTDVTQDTITVDTTPDPDVTETAPLGAGAQAQPSQGAPVYGYAGQVPPYQAQPAQGAYGGAGAPPYGYSQPPRYGYPQYAQQPRQPQQPPKKKKSGLKIFGIVALIVAVICCMALPITLLVSRRNAGSGRVEESYTEREDKGGSDREVNDDGPEIKINSASSGEGLTPAQIYDKIRPSIVAVMIYKNNNLSGEGTGIIQGVDKSGKYTYILTCAHMVDSMDCECVVQLEDGTRFDADVVGFDVRTDVAVIKIEKTGLTAAEFGDSDALSVGDPVYAIGNPGGSEFFGTFTDGIISAIGRSITSSIGYDMVCIQHNAAISPGNSGGALVNSLGQVIGINSSKIAATDYEGIAFAIPITQAKDVIDSVMKHGYVPGRPKLGITYIANNSSSLNSGLYSMVVQMKDLPSGSLVIYSIEDGSDLKNTDAKVGDMIIKVNGKDLDTPDVLLETIENSKVGDELTLTLFRISSQGGRYSTDQFDVKVKLIEETNENSAREEPTTQADPFSDFGFNFGF